MKGKNNDEILVHELNALKDFWDDQHQSEIYHFILYCTLSPIKPPYKLELLERDQAHQRKPVSAQEKRSVERGSNFLDHHSLV